MTQDQQCGAAGRTSERKRMKNYKKVAAVVITAVAITGSASALASASSTKSKSMNSARMTKDGIRKPDRGFAPSNKEAIITSTLGIDATTLRNRIQAGETLAAIAGAKKDALIAALVADETKQIDAAVAAGKLTAEKAATLKSNLTAHVTEEVNAVHGPGMGGKGGPRMDGPGQGQRHHDGDGRGPGHDDDDDDHEHGPDHDHGKRMGNGAGLPKGSTNGIPNTSNSNN